MLLKLISSLPMYLPEILNCVMFDSPHSNISMGSIALYNTLPFIKIHNTGYIFIITMSKVLAKTKISA